jgi:proteasome lid subunit RPN8/RPN11
MCRELGLRGAGVESGAFLLGDRTGDGRTVTQVIYLDDLDPTCLTGAISMNGLAYSALWDICDTNYRRVIGDVHTHPGRFVRQSSIDQANPMVAKPGHVAIILPDFARYPVSAKEVGLHRYTGDGWDSWTGTAARHRLHIGRFIT